MEVLTGNTPDISVFTCYLFWDVCYVARHKNKKFKNQLGSVESDEIRCHFVGFDWDVGHGLTFKWLTCDTNKVISRSVARLAKIPFNNLKLDVKAGAVPEREFIRSQREEGDMLPTINIHTDPISVGDGKNYIEEPVVDDDEDPMDVEEPIKPVPSPQDIRDEIQGDDEDEEVPDKVESSESKQQLK